MRNRILCLCLAVTVTIVGAIKYEPNWKSIDSRPLPEWYDKAKIGIFLHWGVFSVPSFGSEWFWNNWQNSHSKPYVDFMNKNYKPGFTYGEFAEQFTAEFYDPNQWADLFRKAGAKYVVLTSKHHEGYTLWPSKYSFNWNAMDVGPKRDVLGDLALAVRKQNLTFGLYHSLYEWFNPMYLADKAKGFKTNDFVRTKVYPEMVELVNAYKPDIIWSDGDWEASDEYWNSTHFLAWLYNESPVKDTVLVNDRWGAGTACKHGGFWNCEDHYQPNSLMKHKWEDAFTVDKQSWGYRRNMAMTEIHTAHELITEISETIAKGGNVLINVGPTKEGTISPIFQERLLEIGHWLSVNGEAIYESRPWQRQNDTITKNVWYTTRGSNVYAIVLDYHAQLELGAIDQTTAASITSVSLLGNSGPVVYSKSSAHLRIDFPALTPDSPVKYAYVFKIQLKT